MKSKLSILAGAAAGTAFVAAAAHAAPPALVLNTVGKPQVVSPTAQCPGGIMRMRFAAKGTQVLLAVTDVVHVPVSVRKGTATLCALSLRQTTVAGEAITARGTLAIALPQGKITASASEHQSSGSRGPSCSLHATIRSGTGLYRGVAGVIVATGSATPARDGLQCRELTFNFEFA